MQKNKVYPKLFIRSKTELAKHISHTDFPPQQALRLINDVLLNFESYWKDSKSSQPEKNKYVRNAKGTPLGLLLQKIDSKILSSHDKKLPEFIFGGIKGKNHAQAARHLLGKKRKRTLLKLDIKQFFEQIKEARVVQFFQYKCNCSKKAAVLLGKLCCVPLGPKDGNVYEKVIARGFATSPRLAVWCNLGLFLKLDRLVKKRLKGSDPRIIIYVDDIGIMASRVAKEVMQQLYNDIFELFKNSDPNQCLTLHPLGEKSKIISHAEGPRILGLELRRNKLIIGDKTKSKISIVKKNLKRNLHNKERDKFRKKHKALMHYKNYIQKLS